MTTPIPVSERLPEYGEEVLLFIGKPSAIWVWATRYDDEWHALGFYPYEDEESLIGMVGEGTANGTPTHWLPLPPEP